MLNINISHAALTATTANTIQGTAPYIELNGVKATDLSRLLSIKIGSDIYISDNSVAMKRVNANALFNSVGTIVSPDTISYALNSTSIVPTWARKDADGDGTFAITGSIKGEWTDKNGNAIAADASGKSDLTKSPTICKASYTLTLTTKGAPSISTPYGVPNATSYGNNSAVFTINPVSQPTICYAKPDVFFGPDKYAGQAYMWDASKGFLVQSTSAATYGTNFPTTRANELFFDLDIAGVPTTLTWPSVTLGTAPNAITATMSLISNTSVRVTLTRPKASDYNLGATADTPPTLPAQFELVGYSGGTAVVKYGFAIYRR